MKKLNLTIILAFWACILNAQTYNEWYSLEELIISSDGNNYVEFLMKNGESKYVNSSGTQFKGINTIAAGSVIDIADDLWDMTADPGRKMRVNDVSRLDSISFPYLYGRNTESNTINGSTKKVVDTLLVYWFNSDHIRKINASGGSTFAVPGGKWNLYNLTPTSYFKVDTILLTPKDSTPIVDQNGGYENSWQLRLMTLPAPQGLISDSAAQSKLIGYCLQFRSGVIGADEGYMIYQRPPATLPAGTKRPNYFGFTTLNEPAPNSWSYLDYSYSGSVFVDPVSAQGMQSGWFGFISGSAYTNKKIIRSHFYVSSRMRNDPYALAVNVADESCSAKANGSITVSPTGGSAPYQYSINDGPFGSYAMFNNLAPGKYKITVKDASNDTRVINANVWSNVSVVAGLINGLSKVQKGADAMYTAIEQPSSGTTYNWIVNGGIITSGNLTNTVNIKWDATQGSGSVKLVVSNSDCNDTSTLVVVRTPFTGLSTALLNSKHIQYYPIPTSQTLSFDQVKEEVVVEIYNLIGQKELSSHILPSNPTLNVSSLSAGTYIISIKSSEGNQTGRIIIE